VKENGKKKNAVKMNTLCFAKQYWNSVRFIFKMMFLMGYIFVLVNKMFQPRQSLTKSK